MDPRLLAAAIDCVLEAGALHRASYGREVHVARKGAIDLVTEVDLAVEAHVRRIIERRFPTHAILAEESHDARHRGHVPGFCWVLDPLDGTTNFAHGLPMFCVSLGLELDGEAVLGAVYDALRGELFVGERGQGARLNGVPIRVSQTRHLIEALVCTGFPYDVHERLDDLMGLFAAFLGRARAVRRLGSAAVDLCYVAAGRFDGFWEASLKPWDTSAGALIIEEAGGRVTGWDGERYQSRGEHIVAANAALHEAMLAVVSAHARRSTAG